MKITIHNVKYFKSQSRETHCFNATIKVDGEVLCGVENAGHGGGDDYSPVKKSPANWHEQLLKLDKMLGETVISNEYAIPLTNDLEIVVGGLVNDYLVEKELKSILRRRIAYVVDGALYQVSVKYKPTPQALVDIKNSGWWTANHYLLAEMQKDKALEILRQYC